MKKPLLIICLLFAITGFSQQTQEESFPYEREWGTYLPHINVGNAITDFFTLSDNSLFFFSAAGFPFLDNLYPFPPDAEGNLTVGALNLEGQLDWVDKFRLGEETTSVYNIAIDEDDYIYFVGRTRDSLYIGTSGTYMPEYTPHSYNDTIYVGGQEVIGNFPGYAGFIAKYDTSGSQIWGTYVVGDKSIHNPNRLIKQGNYLYYYGQTNSKTGIATHGAYISTAPVSLPSEITEVYNVSFLMKFDANTGERLWGTYMPLSAEQYTTEFIAFGTISVDNEGCAYWKNVNDYIKLNPDGTYHSLLSNPDNLNYYLELHFDSEGNIYTLARNKPNDNTNFGTAGTYKPNKTIDDEFVLVKLTPDFEKIWATYLGAVFYELSYSKLTINEEDNGEILISSSAVSADDITPDAFQTEYGGGDSDAVLMSFDMETGQRKWFSYYGDSETDIGHHITIADEDSFYFTGTSYGGDNIVSGETLYAGEDFGGYFGWQSFPFVAKFVPRKPSSVEENQEVRFSVYPNPSSDQVYIEPINQWQDHLQIKIYTLQGKEVSVTATQMARGYELVVSHLSAGVYVMKIDTGEAVVSYKLVKE